MTKERDNELPTVVRRRFAIEYVRDFNPIEAFARTYGCSIVDLDPAQTELAGTLPSDPFTNECIEQQLTYMQDRTEVDREFLILKTRQILDQCMKATPVMEKVRGQWVEAGEFEFDSLGAIKCVNTLYEITGIRGKGIEVEDDVSTGVLMVPNVVSPDDWASAIIQAKSMQEKALTAVMESVDEKITKH